MNVIWLVLLAKITISHLLGRLQSKSTVREMAHNVPSLIGN